MGFLKTLRSASLTSFFVLTVLSGICLWYLSANQPFRQRVFAGFCNHVTSAANAPPLLMRERCNLLKDVSGDVVEIGAGTGVNFRCWNESSRDGAPGSNIKSWTGVDNNPYMEAYLRNSTVDNHIAFPITLYVADATKLVNISDNSVDSVVLTHLLCSVPDPMAILQEAHRILKPGGTLYFLEHVAADPDKDYILYLTQKFIEPTWKVIGDGCGFRETENDLEAVRASYKTLQYRHFHADIPFPFVRPHIVGTATK